MPQKVYRRVGARRDKNLGDLNSANAALNNLLDDLTGFADIDLKNPESFLSEDLNAFRNVGIQGLTADAYQSVAGSAAEVTDTNGITSKRNPRITFQNRLDQFAVFSGIPRLNGGGGLTAHYYDQENIDTSNNEVFCAGAAQIQLSAIGTGYSVGDTLIASRTGSFGGATDLSVQVKEVNAVGGINVLEDVITNGGSDSTRTSGEYTIVDSSGNGNIPAIMNVVIGNGKCFKVDNFWESGNFDWDGKITPQAADINGGIKWEGHFIPTQTGNYIFTVSSRGNTTFDFEDTSWTGTWGSGIGTYREYNKIGVSSAFTANAYNYPTDKDKIQITGGGGYSGAYSRWNQGKHIGVGLSVTDSAAWENTGSQILAGCNIEAFDSENGIITLISEESGDPVRSNFSGQTINFTKGVNTDVSYSVLLRDVNNNPAVLEEFKQYRIRLRYYLPPEFDANSAERSYNIDFLRPAGTTSSDLSFVNLYDINYDFSASAKGDFIKYLENSVRFGGGSIGSGTPSNPVTNNYVKVQTSKKVDIKYSPPTAFSNAERKTWTSRTIIANSNVIYNTSDGSTNNIEIGNYVIGPGIPDNTRVTQVVINKSVVLDKVITDTGSGLTIKFINHRGYVGWGTAQFDGQSNSQPGHSLLNLQFQSGTNDAKRYPLRTNDIVLGSNIPQWTGISTAAGSNDWVDLINNSQVPSLTNERVYFYRNQGLINNSLFGFCKSVHSGDRQVKCVNVTEDIESGATTINIDNMDDVKVGDKVLGFYFSSGTVIASGGVNVANKTITINQGVANFIKRGNNFTLYTDDDNTFSLADDGDRALCCPPKDTSPPFEATDFGMQTTSDFPSLNVNDINDGVSIFDTLTATIPAANITNNPVVIADPATQYEGVIPIKCGNGTTYKILTTKHQKRPGGP